MTLISRQFRDINLSFKKHPVTKDLLVIKDAEAIKRSVKNIIFTKLGEKFFDPDFGSRVTDALFELDTTFPEPALEAEIITVLENYEPRIENIEVEVIVNGEEHELSATIKYDIIGLPIPSEIIEVVLLPTRA